jgi:transposase
VKALIQEEWGVDYSDDQVVKILRQRLKMHFGKPFPRDYRRPAKAEPRLEADWKAVVERLQHEGLAAQEVALGLTDESSPQNPANTVRVCSFEGKPKAIQNTTRLRSHTMGFYPVQGQPVQSFLPNAKQDSIWPFLQAVREANAVYRAVMGVWGHFSSHQSELIPREAQKMNLYLVPLPPYSPALNPIEYIWTSVKRVLSQGFVRNLDELKEVIGNTWRNLSCRRSFAKAWIEWFLSDSEFYADLCA